MNRVIRSAHASMVIAMLAIGLAAPAAQSDSTEPYGDKTTGRIADKLYDTHRGGWLAVTLDWGCDVSYEGPRKAEIVKIPKNHGRRWVGIIHVTTFTRARRVRGALECQGVWFAQNGGSFVLPVRSSTYTDGCSWESCRTTARWAKKRLGSAWVVR